MQTSIEYNGVRIQDVLTDAISHDPVKDATGVDQVGVRVSFQCTGIVYLSESASQTSDQLGRVLGTGYLADELSLFIKALTKDRRPFRMLIGKSVLYDVKPGAAERNSPQGTITADLEKMDLEHGPKPTLKILKIVSGYSATIQFGIEFVVPNCGGGNDVNNCGLVNFRFWITEDINCDDWLTSRTYSGSLRVAHKGIHPHALARQVAIPPLQRGFKREVVQMSESEDGLHLQFTIRDQEIIAAAPFEKDRGVGASSWSGTFQMSTQNFSNCISDLNFRLTGPKGTTKRDLFFVGMKVVSAKTHFLEIASAPATEPSSGMVFLEHFGVKEELHANTVEFAVRIRHNGTTAQMIGLFNIGGKFEIGRPLGDMGIGYDPQVAFHPGPSATLTGLFLSTLQTPCSPARMPNGIDQPPKNEKPESKPGIPDYPAESQSQIPSAPNEKPSDSHLKAMYLDYSIHSELIVHSGQIAMPTGAVDGGADETLAVVSLFRPTARRHIAISASRVGTPPEIPDPVKSFTDINGIEHKRIGEAKIDSQLPQLSADARRLLYAVDMTIDYALSRPPKDTEKVPIGVLPYRTVTDSDASRTLPPEIFVDPKKMLT